MGSGLQLVRRLSQAPFFPDRDEQLTLTILRGLPKIPFGLGLVDDDEYLGLSFLSEDGMLTELSMELRLDSSDSLLAGLS